MAEEKRYWWLKLEHDFFEQKETRALKRKEDGYILVTIYIKLMLKSLKENGSLFFDGIEDDFISELSLEIDEPIDKVEIVFEFLKSRQLLVEISDQEIQLPGAMIRLSSKTQSAVRMERKRKRDKKTKLLDTVTELHDSYVEKSREEIEKIKEEESRGREKELPTTPPILNENLLNLYKVFEEEIGRSLTQMQIQDLQYMIEDYSFELIQEALREAVRQGKANFAYITSILKRWKQDGLMTPELVRNAKAARKKKKDSIQNEIDPDLGF